MPFYNLPYSIGPIIPQNIFPMADDFIHNLTQKSSFDAGDAKRHREIKFIQALFTMV